MTGALTSLAAAYPWPLAGLALGMGLGTVWLFARAFTAIRARLEHTPAAVAVAGLAAAACTAYSADTSWRFAANHLDMANTTERAALFAAGELALLASALMARQNVHQAGAAGTPGALVWLVTTVQLIPAFAEGGLIGGTVRAVFGPLAAALLWHLAMGLELRHARPTAATDGLLAVLGREARERVLSRLGIASRTRTAEQISRDRATVRAVELADRLKQLPAGSHRAHRTARHLSAAVGRAQVGSSAQQRHRLLQLLAAQRHATALATIDLPSPWETPEPHTDRELRQPDPAAAALCIADAQPNADKPTSIAADNDVLTSPAQAETAVQVAHPHVHPDASPGEHQRQSQSTTRPEPEESDTDGSDTRQERSGVHRRGAADDEPEPSLDDPLLGQARELDATHLAEHGRPAGLRILQRELRIGQPRAQRIKAHLFRK